MKAPLRILILDGHATVRTAVVQWLQRSPGVAVVGAVGDVAEAARLSRKLALDVVLYEPRTVEGDPIRALRELAAAGHPVLVWTSSLLEGEAETLMHAGAAAVLLKGTDLAGLLHTIEAVSVARRLSSSATGRSVVG